MSGEGLARPAPPAALAAFQETSGRSERRILTALCYDLVGSTNLLTVLDIEDVQELLSAFRIAARQAVVNFAGHVMSDLGDGGLALFPTDIDPKDAASLAIRAGLEIVEACKRVGFEQGQTDLHVRVGIATSMSLIQERHEHLASENVTSAALALCTRLQAIAMPDTVFVSHQTRSLARRSHLFSFRGSHSIKGFSEPERVWQALRHKRDVDRFFAFGRLSSPLVGRAKDLAVIADCWNNAANGRGGVVIIEGEAGIGKSRLLHEVRRTTRLGRSKVLLFQCLPGGSQSALHPLLNSFPSDSGDAGGPPTVAAVAELFERQGVLDADVVDTFSFLLGAEGAKQAGDDVDPAAIRTRASWAARRALDMICRKGPLLLVVEDVHWLDPTSKQMVAEIGAAIQSIPALLVATTRNSTTADWLPAHATRIKLQPLDRQDTRLAIAAMWPESKSSNPAELIEVFTRVTGGVPLFIEEVCQWMSESAGSATETLAQTSSPSRASIFESILSARLEPLGPAKDVAHAASVAGNRFDQRLLGELLPELAPQTIGHALEALSEAGFLTRIRPSPVPAYSFRHAMIQESIYNGLLRKRKDTFNSRLFRAVNRDRDIAPWFGPAALADRAERAGMLESAIELFVKAGTESYSRSAMVEARHLLEHALRLCDRIRDPGRQDTLRLSAMVALGPVLTSTEGPSSPPARKLYDDGVIIARRRPVAERATWFPIFWGWWFTGTDVDGARGQAVLRDVRDVEDAEVQLQARHCVWAIDFYLGRHDSCLAAVEEGLALYQPDRARQNVTLFGGHDARVCGLSHGGLSKWFTGQTTTAVDYLSEAREWAQQLGHVGSIAHACNNRAMLDCYRRDFSSLRTAIGDIRDLTLAHHLPSLAATAQILEGWCEANAGNIGRGIEKIREGLAIHAKLQTPEDYPVYCDMLAELLGQTGDAEEALDLLTSAAADAEQSGHRYWLAQLHCRRARLLFQQAANASVSLKALSESLQIASEQNAVPILLGAYEVLLATGLSDGLASRYRDRIENARSKLDPDQAMIVNPEPKPRRHPAKRH